MGWNAPHSAVLTGPAISSDKRAQAVALANIISLAPQGMPISIPQLQAGLGAAWEAGAEEIVDLLTENGLAQQAGDGDAETVTFLVAPNPAYV